MVGASHAVEFSLFPSRLTINKNVQEFQCSCGILADVSLNDADYGQKMKQSKVVVDNQIKDALAVDHARNREPKAGEISISCFENEVPPFVAAEMVRLYQNFYSSLEKFRIDGNAEKASTYVVRKAGTVINIFLFRRENRIVRVMNELIEINETEIDRFANYIFSMFKSVAIISFNVIQTDVKKLSFPYQRFNASEDAVITLPESPKEYLASLGSATRQNIKRYTSKLNRSFPSFTYQFFEKEGVTEQHIRDIVRMKLARMADKNKVSGINEGDVEQILAFVRECGGLVGIATINGSVCGGLISYRVGANYFMPIIAHDPAYNDYRLGILCCYASICECIRRGGKEFHLIWGREEYKYRFLGIQRDLDNLNVFRSSTQFVLNIYIALYGTYKAYVRYVKLWLLDPKNRRNLISRIAIKSMHYLKNFRRTGLRKLTQAKINTSQESLRKEKK